jgi:hypothetical protein
MLSTPANYKGLNFLNILDFTELAITPKVAWYFVNSVNDKEFKY